MTAGRGRIIPGVVCMSFFFRHCRAPFFLSPSFSGLARESRPSFPVSHVFLSPSFSWSPRESSPRPHCIFLECHVHFPTPSFSWPPRESSPRPHSGFPPSARMTEGRGRIIPGVVCVSFFFRHCRAPFFLSPSFSWSPRESSPRPHSGFPPSARMTAGRGGRGQRGGAGLN